jgi:two-component system, OmpR family, sensor histidine kinase VicK
LIFSQDDHSSKTEVLYGEENIMNTISQFLSNDDRIDACGDSNAPAFVLKAYRKLMENAKKEQGGIRLRFLTDINRENISYCKELMKIAEVVRHIEGIKANFAVRTSDYIGIATSNPELQPSIQSHIIYSNVRGIIEQQQYLFNSLWEKSIRAEQRIEEIEKGVQAEFFEIINDNKRISEILTDLAKSVVNEVVLLLPNDKALMRIDKLGVIDSLLKASRSGAIIKIICPLSEENKRIQKKIFNASPNVRLIDGSNSQHGLYIIDSLKFLRVELVKPEAESFLEAIGFAIYSNNKRSADLYRWMFELLWNERIINLESKKSNQMQKEFMNVAAHELRTPIQPIVGLAHLLRFEKDYMKGKEQESLDIIIRNAERLQRLAENILDASRIESQRLTLRKVKFKLDDLLSNIVHTYYKEGMNSVASKKGDVSVLFEPPNENIVVEADKERISQVVRNILSNALEFTNEGNVLVTLRKERQQEKERAQIAVVTVADTGCGIDSAVMPKIFEKFVTRSDKGTGLGLFVSKSIIQAHEGEIWVQNNTKGQKGATFCFTLPCK